VCEGRWRPLLLTLIFTGLRASELRGLRWIDIDLKRGEIHVRQRADRYNEIGPPKSEAVCSKAGFAARIASSENGSASFGAAYRRTTTRGS